VYGNLAFGPSRPVAVKAYDEKGLGRYGNFLRLNAAFRSEKVEQALETVGSLIPP
jgi:hypothetical protein